MKERKICIITTIIFFFVNISEFVELEKKHSLFVFFP